MASLHVVSGPLAGRTFDVGSELTIGRDSDLTIDDPELSRRHLVVRPLPGALEILDLGSKNGTYVDDVRIDGPTRVGGGAKVRFGGTVVEVHGVVPVGEPTRVRPIADVAQPTRARPIADVAQPTRAREVPVAPQAAGPAIQMGQFSPPVRRRRGLASRSWVPVVLSFSTVIVTAIALVVYFGTR